MKKIFTLASLIFLFSTTGFSQGNHQKQHDSFSHGDVVVSNTGRLDDGILKRSDEAYSDHVVGIFVEKTDIYNIPSILQNGIAYMKFDNTNGEVIRGDYLTSSTKAGYGMKAKKPGMMIGVAMENSANSSNNVIKVRVQILWINKI